MKKNLLTFLFVMAFVCGGATVASAKNSSSLGNSVTLSEGVSPAKIISNKIKALKAKCGVSDCGHELQLLLNINDIYESHCAAGGYQGSCEPGLAGALISAGADYERCLGGGLNAKNTDRTMDRAKIEKSLVQRSKV